jgi:predicted DNA-binding protein with PD1-like motif
MIIMKRVKPKEVIMGRLTYGGDLLEEISNMCLKENIQLGWFEALGAVKRARLAFYNQETHEYEFFVVKDGHPFVHAHITLSDKAGKAYGGHLAPGTMIFACEFKLEVFDGRGIKRDFDEATGLPLWKMSE